MSVVTVASNKGGVGKTTLAIELAYMLGGVLVDLDHDDGGATAGWPDVGVLAPEFARRALLSGDGPGPRVIARDGLPGLIPAHPDYGPAQLPAQAEQPPVAPADVADRLQAWAAMLEPRALIADTHPGFSTFSLGAMMASTITLVPVLLQERELRAFDGLVAEFRDYPLASIPYRVPRWGSYQQASTAPLHERWKAIATAGGVRVGPTVSEWREWPRRRASRALLASGNPGEWAAQAQEELRQVAAWVAEIAGLPAPAAVTVG